jgi:ferredoxin
MDTGVNAGSRGAKIYNITVRNTGTRFLCGEREFILEAMKRSRCGPVHYGCFGGGCGVCKMRVISGEYRAEKRMSRAYVSKEEQEGGVVLICCVRPCEDMIIERVDIETEKINLNKRG